MALNSNEKPGSAKQPDASKSPLSVEELRDWIAQYLATHAGVAPSALNSTERFQVLGLDSLGAIAMLRELGKSLKRNLSPSLAWEYPTPESLARQLADAKSEEPAAASDSRASLIKNEPIAIVGLACRFPGGATSPAAYWNLLREGVDAVTKVPAERWTTEAVTAEDAAQEKGARLGAFLEQVDTFDAPFFAISPREAVQMDPQQRLLLELSWEALEDAGIPPSSLRDSQVGVFVGVIWHDYADLHLAARSPIDTHTGTGQSSSIVANRISYVFGWNGPSIAINTACSSSLVAIHLACQSLRAGECELSLVGGVNLLLSPRTSEVLTEFGGLSPSGRCHAFGADADGFVRGEGGGLVVLKPLSRALADGDHIYCVIRGSAVNSDGASNGLTAPNPAAQRAVLRDACARAGVSPRQVHYVEAHGTGTRLGDPIEAEALGAVLGRGRDAEAPLLVGSVKTNVGHLEGAAGIAGLIKVALSIEHRHIPPSLHCEPPNPLIQFAALRLRVPTQLTPWPLAGAALAGVSSFGWGGTNCHVLLGGLDAAPLQLLAVADKDESSLAAHAAALAESVARGAQTLAELCAKPHGHGSFRLAVCARTPEELLARLAVWRAGGVSAAVRMGRARAGRRKVAFVFSPQGGQWRGMATELLRQRRSFSRKIRECDSAIRRYAGFSLLAELHSAGSRAVGVDIIQPSIFAVQVALAAELEACGVVPDVVVGHSLGEIAAAHVAGALSLDDAVQVVVHYSRLQASTSGNGGMALVGLPADQAEQLAAPFCGAVCVAGHNGPATTVLSGSPAELNQILADAASRGVFGARIDVDVATHSPQMDPILDALRRELAWLRPVPCRVPMWATSIEGRVKGPELDGAWFARNLREPVRFQEAVNALAEQGVDVFLEVNPHPILGRALRQGLEALGHAASVLGTTVRTEPESESLLDALGRLWLDGVDLHTPRGETAVTTESLREVQPVMLSARTEAALADAAAKLQNHLAENPKLALHDVAFSLATTRSALEHRLAMTATTRQGLHEQLQTAAQGQTPAGAVRGSVAPARGKLAFLFTGQGAQVPGMGRGLYAAWPAFRAAFDQCLALFDPELERPLREVMWAESGSEEAALLDQTAYTQPALFAMEYALYVLWDSLGVKPDLVAGHSIGELVAACAAGVFSLQDATRLCAARGRLMQALPARGAMVSIAVSEAEVAQVVARHEGQVSIAAINGPRQVVIAGDKEVVEELAAEFAAQGVRTKRLAVSHAFHSPRMEPMMERFLRVAETVTYRTPKMLLVSNVSGKLCADQVCTAEYWVRHVREAVRFADGVKAMQEAGVRTFVEVGPQATLLGLLPACLPESELGLHASMRTGRDEAESVLEALGGLWTAGKLIEWRGVFPHGSRRVTLPTYAWQRKRYWLQPPSGELRPSSRQSPAGLLGHRVHTPLSTVLFESRLDKESLLPPEPGASTLTVPSSLLIAMAVEVMWRNSKGAPVSVLDVTISVPTHGKLEGGLLLQVVLDPSSAESGSLVGIHSPREAVPESPQPWFQHLGGRAKRAATPTAARGRRMEDIPEIPPTHLRLATGLGPDSAVTIERLAFDTAGTWALIRMPPWPSSRNPTPLLRPDVLEACLRLPLRAVEGGDAFSFMPVRTLVGCQLATAWRPVPTLVVCRAALVKAPEGSEEAFSGDEIINIDFFDREGDPLALLTGARTRVQSTPVRQDLSRYHEHPEELLAELRTLLAAEVPDRAALDDNTDLASLGLDSLGLMGFLRSVERHLGVPLSVSRFFDMRRYSTTISLRYVASLILRNGDSPTAAGSQESPLPPSSQAETQYRCEPSQPLAGYPDVFLERLVETRRWRFSSGLELEVAETGQGPPLVLLPPIGCELVVWKELIEALASEHRVLAINYPGYGRSPFQPALTSLESLAAATLAILDAVVPECPVHVVGWSFGGFLGQILAERASSRIRTLTLVNTTSHLDMGSTMAEAGALQRSMLDDLRRELGRCPSSQAAEAERLVYWGAHSRPLSVPLHYAGLVATWDFRTRASSIRTPTLIVAGAEDLPTPPQYSIRMKEAIAGSWLVVMPEAGHYVPLFHPETFLQFVTQHIANAAKPQ